MMFRMRRYRVFLVFAIIALGALYHFTSLSDLETAGAASVEGLKNFGQKGETRPPPPVPKPEVKDATISGGINSAVASPSLAVVESAEASQKSVVSDNVRAKPTSARFRQPVNPSAKEDLDLINPKATPATKPPLSTGSVSANKTSKPNTGPADPVLEGGGGRLEIIAETSIPKIHWSQLPEHFPVPTESLIQLPTGAPKAIPKIQHEFTPETSEEESERKAKRDKIREAFVFSWAGYKKKAWMQDELSPVSGKFRNPFCAWGATLVDSLDTLYMMDLEDDFEEAVDAIKDIDFTTSPRNDIPLFETVIRYLGGLVAAYDISDGTRRILLDKAVELADILIGAFDTPNRMPMTFYLWKPTFASQPHRAKTRVVLAELGSLSVEFTRLAQITKEAKYYDAIARITNEFEIWQNNTRLPGLWPLSVDASGCKKPDVSTPSKPVHTGANAAAQPKPLGVHGSEDEKGSEVSASQLGNDEVNSKVESDDSTNDSNPVHPKAPSNLPIETSVADMFTERERASDSLASTATGHDAPRDGLNIDTQGAIRKRDVQDESSGAPETSAAPKPPECEPQGLASPPFTPSEDFGIGGQADSTYEYLPKEYMLLGGLEDKYRTMYEMAADTITKELLYRTMIPDEDRSILHPGLRIVATRPLDVSKVPDQSKPRTFKPEGTHLGCFAGGMYAVGAKIFSREGDLKIAKELTDGCVWAYESTTTGIMPESYLALQCADKTSCPWNETYWHEQLDPYGETREKSRIAQQQVVLQADKKPENADSESSASENLPHVTSNPEKTTSLPEVVAPVESASQLVEVSAGAQPGPSIDNNMFKSAEGTAGLPDSPAPEQSADKSAPLAAGGASVEQPLSPPGDVTLARPLERRQLGELNEVHPDADPSETTKEPFNESPTDHTRDKVVLDKSPPMNSSSAGSNSQGIQKDSRASSGSTNETGIAYPSAPLAATYTPPPIPTREEFVKARIHNERLPEGMTKVTGARYLLR